MGSTSQRYERETPGDLIHIDVKKLARFRRVGHRITGNRQQGRSAGVGRTPQQRLNELLC